MVEGTRTFHRNRNYLLPMYLHLSMKIGFQLIICVASEIVRNFSASCKFVRNFVRNLSEILIFCPKINVRKFNVRNLSDRNFLKLMYLVP